MRLILSQYKIFHNFMHMRAKTICEFQISEMMLYNRCLPPLRHPEPWSVGDGPGGPSVPYLGTKTGHIYASSFSTNGERSPQGVPLWTVGAHLFSRGSDGQRWPVMASDALDDG